MPNPSTICTALIVPAQGIQRSISGDWMWLWKVVRLNGDLLYHVHAKNAVEAMSFYNNQGDLYVLDNKLERYVLNSNYSW